MTTTSDTAQLAREKHQQTARAARNATVIVAAYDAAYDAAAAAYQAYVDADEAYAAEMRDFGAARDGGDARDAAYETYRAADSAYTDLLLND